jgi:two-component system chemotaxis sensor kinase CheA
MDEILGEFIAETLETLETLSGEVVAWEADPTDRSRLDAFFRFFHTVKGSCGFLNLPRFERLAHSAEDVLAAVRRGERLADPSTVTAVLAVMDRIGELARGLGGEGSPPEADDDALLDALSSHSGGFEIFAPLPVTTPEPVSQSEPAAEIAPVVAAPTIAVEAAPSSSPSAGGREKAPRTIRLPLALIDQLMSGISDMVLARNDLARKMRDYGVASDVESSFERLSSNVADLRDMISKTRMQRVDRLYAAIPRMVRDLTRELGKHVSLELDGGDVEMDREMVEMVVDPLTHLVRNALDHGIERPADRVAAGKPPSGRLSIVARQSGNQIVIEISDDGRGIDRAKLVDKAISVGLLTPADAVLLSDAEKLNLIFHPGLSTATAVTPISGRGVGMDVVRANVEQIGGVIDLATSSGQGTVITMRVPLTLTIIPGLIVRSGKQFFAMPRGNVIELIHDNSATISMEQIGGARIVTVRGERYPVIELEDVLKLSRRKDATGPRTLMVIRSSAGHPYVLDVESVEGNEELVIRPASPVIAATGAFAGMTLPDNGQPMLLLDAAGLVQIAQLPLIESDKARRATEPQQQAVVETLRVLLYRDRDGVERLMPLPIVDRVEDLQAAQISITHGRAFARLDGKLVPALNARPDDVSEVKAMRLYDGHSQLCFLIDDVLDILEIPARLEVAVGVGRIAGLVLVGERQMELVDPFTLFAEVAMASSDGGRSWSAIRCLIADVDDPWMRNILAPLLLQAGHEVSFGLSGDQAPDLVLCSSDQAVAMEGVPVLALRDQPDVPDDLNAPPSIFRYDRSQLMAAISSFGRRAA